MALHALAESFSKGEMKFPAALLITTWAQKSTQGSCNFKTQLLFNIQHDASTYLLRSSKYDFSSIICNTILISRQLKSVPTYIRKPNISDHLVYSSLYRGRVPHITLNGTHLQQLPHRLPLRLQNTWIQTEALQNNKSNKSHFIALNQCLL